MGSRARVNERERGWSMVSIGGGGGTFLVPDVWGKLKISPAAWRGSRTADTHRSVRELAADPVSAHSRPIMLPVMCVQPPYNTPATLPPCLYPSSNISQREKAVKGPGSNLQSNAGCHTPRWWLMAYILWPREERRTESELQMGVFNSLQSTCVDKTRHPPCVHAAQQLAMAGNYGVEWWKLHSIKKVRLSRFFLCRQAN